MKTPFRNPKAPIEIGKSFAREGEKSQEARAIEILEHAGMLIVAGWFCDGKKEKA